MQTRRQAKQAAELVAAVQAVVQSTPHPPPSIPRTTSGVWAPSFASSLSDLTPTSSFMSDAGTAEPTNLHSIGEGDTEDDEGPSNRVATAARNFGVPQFPPRGGRSLRTPVHSQSNFYPAEVFETPRKNTRVPLEEQQRAARVARDSEIARSGGLAQLTRGGTLLVPPDDSETEQEGTGSGLGSAFASPGSERVWKRTTATASKASPSKRTSNRLQETKTRRCNFHPEVLMCRLDSCLMPPQIPALHKIYSPLYGRRGDLIYLRFDPGAEGDSGSDLFSRRIVSRVENWIKYAVINDTEFDFSKSVKLRLSVILSLTVLSTQIITSGNSKRVYDLIAQALDSFAADVHAFYRLFLVPGMGHRPGGPSATRFGQFWRG
ncbi:hypothetical protein C8F04DRAFT_1315922 [Mycena alexandri]|uniref:feruloyl esterase n=1 Tax=Mycena alexandri TaxID=1745969 RepID=A0AAD6T6B9_9AGAR|nr:hypothetical protein C8F04DRAFT_1315922 [Mycena alexandri]